MQSTGSEKAWPGASPAWHCCLLCFSTVSFVESEWKWKSLSRVRLFVTPWTVARQDPLSMEFSRQEYWSGLPFPTPRDLPNPVIEPRSPTLQVDSLSSEPPGKGYVEITGQFLGNRIFKMMLNNTDFLCANTAVASTLVSLPLGH